MTASMHDPRCKADLGPAAALFRSLGDPGRLMIVHQLAQGERRVVDLTRALGLAQSTVSGHLACLAECGLVDSRPAGRASMFRLIRPELAELLGAAEALLGPSATAAPFGEPVSFR
jgi:DNA-binding transcriptional ArsR family regulator